MTPAQQAALEALAGRALTGAEITAIDPLLPERNDVAIAAILSAGRTRIESKQIGRGTILAVMAPMGGLFLGTLRDIGDIRPRTMDSANVAEVVGLIDRGEFDIGMDASREQLQLFATANSGMAPGIAALLALAETADPIHYNAVSDALNIAEGRLTL